MKLYLIRHGHALSDIEDSERPLSEEGRAEIQSVASFLKTRGVHVHALWHSDKKRAAQTAEIIAETLNLKDTLKEVSGFTPNASLEGATEKIKEFLVEKKGDLAIATHLPFVQKLTSELLVRSEDEEFIEFFTGTIVALESLGGWSWRLLWAVHPGLLKG